MKMMIERRILFFQKKTFDHDFYYYL